MAVALGADENYYLQFLFELERDMESVGVTADRARVHRPFKL